MDTKLSFFVVFRGIFEESRTVVRTVCGECCGPRSLVLGIFQQIFRQFSHRQVLSKFVDVWHEDFHCFL